jgi:hypothetical protein
MVPVEHNFSHSVCGVLRTQPLALELLLRR